MKMLIEAEKTKAGKYKMVAITPGKKEYPQEGYEHDTRAQVYADARLRTQSRLDRLRLLDLCMIYNNARIHLRSISFHAGIQYQTNLLKKYLD